MAQHLKLSQPTNQTRISRLIVTETQFGSNIRFPRLGIGWPQLALKLDKLGFNSEISTEGKRLTINTNAKLTELRSMVLGRKLRSKPIKYVMFISLALAIALLAFWPVGAARLPVKHIRSVPPVSQTCGNSEIENWLRGVEDSNDISIVRSSNLGGVNVGTLDCRGARYRYTLESNGSKRVLNLVKLDS